MFYIVKGLGVGFGLKWSHFARSDPIELLFVSLDSPLLTLFGIILWGLEKNFFMHFIQVKSFPPLEGTDPYLSVILVV